jgi:DnaK suppressor protein
MLRQECPMNRDTLIRFKALFEEQKKNLVYSTNVIDENFHIQPDDLLDDVDMTSTELETSMRMRLRNREALFAKKIDEALARIADGTFGSCEECQEEIEARRLEARPTATKCVACKEVEERMETLHIDGHRVKSIGKTIKLA